LGFTTRGGQGQLRNRGCAVHLRQTRQVGSASHPQQMDHGNTNWASHPNKSTAVGTPIGRGPQQVNKEDAN
jgi:hypothetical protein